MCSKYHCITCMCKSHLHLVGFLFVPALFYTLKLNIYLSPHLHLVSPILHFEIKHLLVSSPYVLSDVIVEDIVGLCTCTYNVQKGNGVLFTCSLLWYMRSIVKL